MNGVFRLSRSQLSLLPLPCSGLPRGKKITTLPVTRVVFGEQECVSPVTAPPSSAGPERQSPDYKGSAGGVALFKALESRNSRHSGQEERGAL